MISDYEVEVLKYIKEKKSNMCKIPIDQYSERVLRLKKLGMVEVTASPIMSSLTITKLGEKTLEGLQ